LLGGSGEVSCEGFYEAEVNEGPDGAWQTSLNTSFLNVDPSPSVLIEGEKSFSWYGELLLMGKLIWRLILGNLRVVSL